MSLRRLFGPLLTATALGLVACAASSSDSEQSAGALIAKSESPMTKARLDAILAASPDLRSLDQLPAALPKDFVINVVLKHGTLRAGQRGHLVDTDISQSADPQAPRAILWDERSGFAVSYNGGTEGQTEGNRLDLLEFDDTSKAFHLSGLAFNGTDPPVVQTDATIVENDRKCAHCHGAQQRPIFGMYPDWPAFYGSDNDELTDTSKDVQRRELADFNAFRSQIETSQSPRYVPLFDRANIPAQLRGVKLYPSFPYRQDTATLKPSVSRAFAFRPSLRFGIVMNRLMAQATAKKITDHANFAKFGPLFLHDLLECRWSTPSALQKSGWMAAVTTENGSPPRTVAGGRTFHYRDLLKIFGLEVRDVDIRYSYNHAGYTNEDASSKVMEVGYIDGAYWNSYFDGSATIDELLAMRLFQTLSETPELRDIASLVPNPDGLEVKYSSLTERFAFDKSFFQEMDRKGRWIPIPYPKAKLDEAHHREGFPDRFVSQHAALCGALEKHLNVASTPPTAAKCPATCVASSFCKNHPNASGAIKVDGLPCVTAGAGGCQGCR
jgi:hypothetical protein